MRHVYLIRKVHITVIHIQVTLPVIVERFTECHASAYINFKPVYLTPRHFLNRFISVAASLYNIKATTYAPVLFIISSIELLRLLRIFEDGALLQEQLQ